MNNQIHGLITVTNILESTVGFATYLDTMETCYVPSSVITSGRLEVGKTYHARLTANKNVIKKDRTPWLVTYASSNAPMEQLELDLTMLPPTIPLTKVEEDVRAMMLAGGVWTTGSMFAELYPKLTRVSHPSEYNKVSHVLRAMFRDDECTKWMKWASSQQTKPSAEWFSCFPETVDVAEFADEDA